MNHAEHNHGVFLLFFFLSFFSSSLFSFLLLSSSSFYCCCCLFVCFVLLLFLERLHSFRHKHLPGHSSTPGLHDAHRKQIPNEKHKRLCWISDKVQPPEDNNLKAAKRQEDSSHREGTATGHVPRNEAERRVIEIRFHRKCFANRERMKRQFSSNLGRLSQTRKTHRDKQSDAGRLLEDKSEG